MKIAVAQWVLINSREAGLDVCNVVKAMSRSSRVS